MNRFTAPAALETQRSRRGQFFLNRRERRWFKKRRTLPAAEKAILFANFAPLR